MVVTACCSYITTSTGRLVARQEVLYPQTAPFHSCINIPPATTQQPASLKNKHGGLWIQRISASVDTDLLMIEQQLRSGGGFGPACMRTTVHIPLGAKTQICHCSFFRCSQTPQTFPLSWENATGPALCSRRTVTNARAGKTHIKEATLTAVLSSPCCLSRI